MVRALMYQNAPIDIMDNLGQSAIEVARSLNDSPTKEEIIKLLSQRTTLTDILHCRKPIKKVNKSMKKPFAYFLLNAYTYSISYLITMPLWKQWSEIYFVFMSLSVATIFWIISTNRDPGFIKPHSKVDFLVSNVHLSAI